VKNFSNMNMSFWCRNWDW